MSKMNSSCISKFLGVYFILCLLFLTNNVNAQTYSTAGTYQWTCPAGVTSVQVQCWGGGGGGCGSSNSANLYLGGGGAGGNYSKATISVTPGNSYTIVVGAGGTGGSTSSSTGYGGDGGTSSFATSLYASGGCGGWGGGAVIKAGLGGVNGGVKYTTVTTAGAYSVAPTTITFGTAWTASTAYTLNQQIYAANGKLYTVTVAGTSGSSTPTHTSGSAANGSATLTYAGVAATGSIGTSGTSPNITVSYISISNPGSGYIAAPSVNISGGTFTTAATATSTINTVNVTGATTYYLGGNGGNGAYIASCTSNVSGAGGGSAGTSSNGNNATNASVGTGACGTAIYTASAFGAAVTGGGAGAAGVTTTATNGNNATELGGGGSGAVGSTKTGGSGYQGQVIISYPVISNTGSLSAFTTTTGTASASQSFSVSGANMFAGITVTAPSGFEVSSDNSTFSNSITIGSSGTISASTVYVRITAAATVGNYNSLNVALSSTGSASVNVAIPNSTVTASTTPAITLSTTSLSTFVGSGLTEKTFTISGVYLSTNDVTISAPTNFQISTTSGSGFGSSVTLTPSSGTVASTTIYVKFIPTGSGSNSGNISVSCTGVSTQTISVSGNLGQYYYTSGSLSLTSSWNTAADGSGSSPADFTTDGVTYTILKNAITTAPLTITGTGAKIVVGDPSNVAVSLTIDSSAPITATIDVAAASSGSNNLILKSSTYPTFGTLNAASTVTYAGTRLTISNSPTYGNLAISNTYDSVFLASNITVKDLTISGAGLLSIDNVVGASGKSLTIQGNLNISGTGGITNRLNSGNNNTLILSGTSKTITNTATGNNLSKNNITISGSYALASNFDFATGTNARTISGAGSLDISGYTLNLNYGNTTLSTITTNATSVIKTSEKTTTAPIPSGRTWNGLVEYAWSSGLQSIVAGTYNDLKLSNTSGTDTVRGNIVVNGTLTTTAGGTLDLGIYSLTGTLSTVSNSGTIKTSNTSSAPIPSGKTWGGTVNYYSTNGAQAVVAATYNNLTLLNSSGTDTAKGDIVVNGTFTSTDGGSFDMSTYLLSGSLTGVANSGYLKTSNITSTPIPTGKTWNGTIEFAGASTAIPSATSYNNVNITSSLVTLSSDQTIRGNLIISGSGKLTFESSVARSLSIAGNLSLSGTGGLNYTGSSVTTITLSGTGKTITNTASGNSFTKTSFLINGSYSLASDFNFNTTLSSRYFGGTGTLDISGYTLDLGIGYITTSTITTNSSSVLKIGSNISQNNTPIPSGRSWNGTVRYTLTSGIQAISSGTFNNLQLDNTSGADSLRGDVTVNGQLSLNAGILATSSYKIIAAGSVSRTSGWVNGKIQKPVSSIGNTVFEIGDASQYSPISLSFSAITNSGNIIASTTKTISTQSAISNIGLNSTSGINRFYTLTSPDGLTGTYSGTFSFSNSSDLIGSPTISNLVSATNTTSNTWLYNGRVASNTTTSVTTKSISNLGDFVFVSPNQLTVTADSKTKNVGEQDPTLTYTLSSGTLNNGDSLTGTLTRETGDTSGIYAIQRGSLSVTPNSDNYLIDFVSANFIILSSDPIITVSTASLSAFPATSPGAVSSISQSFNVLGANLGNNDITINAPQNFVISLTINGTYSNSITLSPVNGNVSSTNVYVKYSPTGNGSSTGNILISNNAPNVIISNTNISVSGYQNKFYYKGTGSLASTSNWSGTLNGTGTTTPSNFTTAGITYVIPVNATTTESWAISGAGSKVVVGDQTLPGVTLTIENTDPIAGTIDVSSAASGSNAIIVKDASMPNIGTMDPSGELHLQNNFTLTSALPQISNLFVDGNNNTLILSAGSGLVIQSSLTINSGCTLFSQGTSSIYTLIKTGGIVTINGTFKTSKSPGFVSFNAGTGSTGLGAIQFVDAENPGVNLILGNTSTIEYVRDASATVQNITARSDYNNLTISGADNNKIINGPSVVNGTFNLIKSTGSSLNTITDSLKINGTILLGDTLKRTSFITFGNGATINRSTGMLDSIPVFSGNVQLIYSGTTSCTMGLEYPSNQEKVTSLTINNTGGVTMDSSKTIYNDFILNSGALVVGGKTLTLNGKPITIVSGSITTDSTSTINFGGNDAGPFTIPSSVNSLYNLSINNINSNPVVVNALGSLIIKNELNYSNDTLSLGNNSLTINGSPFSGTGGILTTALSSLSFGGNNAGPFRIPASVKSVNNITINNTNAVPATLNADAAIAASGSLNLTSGKFNDNGYTIIIGGNITGTGTHLGSGKLRMTGSSKTISSVTLNNIEIANGASIVGSSATIGGIIEMNGGNFTAGTGNATKFLNGATIIRGNTGSFNVSGGSYVFGNSSTDLINLIIRSNVPSSAEWPSSTSPGKIGRVTIDSSYSYSIASSASREATSMQLNGSFADNGATVTIKGNLTGTGTHSGLGKILINNNADTTTLSGVTLNNVEVNNTGNGIINLGSNITFNGNLTLSSGTLNVGDDSLTLKGVINTGNGKLTTDSTSTLILSGSTADAVVIPSTVTTLKNFSINKTNASPVRVTTNGSLRIDNAFTISDDTLSVGANTLTLNGGPVNVDAKIITTSSSSLVFGGNQPGPMNIPSSVLALNTLTINNTNSTPATIQANSAFTTSSSLNITKGTFSDNGYTVTVAGNINADSGYFIGTGKIRLTGTGKNLYARRITNLETYGTATVSNVRATIAGTFTMNGGNVTINALSGVANLLTMANGSSIIRYSGNMVSSGGTFNVGTSSTDSMSLTIRGNLTSSIEFPGGSGNPGRIKQLTIDSGYTYTLTSSGKGIVHLLVNGNLIDGGATLSVRGNISGMGTHTGTGRILLTTNTIPSTIQGVTLGNLEINQSAGCKILNTTNVNKLFLTLGVVSTDTFRLIANDTVFNTTNAGWVYGNLQKPVNTTGNYTFEIGDSLFNYTPANLNVTSISNNGSLIVSTKKGLSYLVNYNTLALNKLKALNRYFNVKRINNFSGYYTGTYTFMPTDTVGNPTISALRTAINTNGSAWNYPGQVSASTSTTVTVPNNNYFGDVALASANEISITANQNYKQYGQPDPTLTYTLNGVLNNGDTISGSLTREAGEDAGVYAIQQGTIAISPNSANYILNFIPSDFVVLADINPITSFNATHTSDNIVRLSWTKPLGNYTKVLIFAKSDSVTHIPSGNGGNYNNANSNINMAGVYSTNNYLVYADTGSSVEITGLTNLTRYNFVAYAYNGTSYSIPAKESDTTAVPTTIDISSNPSYAQTTISWSNPSYYNTQSNYWDEVLVLARATFDVNQTPSGNGSNYVANATYGSGTDLGSGNYVVYKGTGNSVTVNGFTTTNVKYYYKTFVRHGSQWSLAQSTNATPVPYQVGDYSMKSASGGYWYQSGATGWNTWNGSSWVTATTLPSSNNNVIVLSGQTVLVDQSSSRYNHCKNLIVDSGAVLKTNTTGSAKYIYIFGNTIQVKPGGMIGNSDTSGNNVDAVSFAISTKSLTVTGGGTINISRFRNDTNNVSLIINTNVTLTYHGSSFGGNAGAYHTDSTSSCYGNHSITVNAGKKLTFAPWACITPKSSAHVNNTISTLTLNINGTMTFVDGNVPGNSVANGWANHNNGYINMGTIGSGSSINVGSSGTLNVSELYPNGNSSDNSAGTGSLIDINIAAGGVINVSKIADFRNPLQTVSGNGRFAILNGATFKIGSTDGITKSTSGNTGQIVTNERIFNKNVNYSYEGSSIQNIGDGLPDTVSALTINNPNRVNINKNIIVNDSLVLTSGKFITNDNNILALGLVTKSNGWVAGNLKKYISTGATTKTFEIGDTLSYKPISITFGNVTTAGYLIAKVAQSSNPHPNAASSMISSTKRLLKYWNLTNNGIIYNNYAATFNFNSSDILNSASTSNFLVSNFNGSTWNLFTPTSRTTTSTIISGVSAMNDFLIGESCKTTKTDVVTACDSIVWNGITYKQSNNTATWVGVNADGCDSTVTLNLTVKYSSKRTETISACDSLTWHGTTFIASTNTATWTGQNAVGCDSVVTLNLTIKKPTYAIQNYVVWDSLNWHGVTYTASTNRGQIPSYLVNTKDALISAVTNAQPGDTIVIENGVYNWGNINVSNSNGSATSNWIVIKAQSLNGVNFVGNTYFQFGGNRIHVTGFKFSGGNAGGNPVIAFRSSTTNLANYSRVSNIYIDNYNSETETENEWIALYGIQNRVDHCSFINKSNARATVVLWYSTATFPNKSISTYHKIDSNYFNGRSYMGGNGGETIRMGVGNNSRTDGYNLVEANLFENCTQTEPEIVSNKSCHNTYRYNTFRNCNGGLTLRMGKYCDVYSNSFINNDATKTGSYGIRIIDKGHRVFNNYMEGLIGNDNDLGGMRSPIIIYNGEYSQADSLNPLILNGTYIPADDALVAFNTIVNCKGGAGINLGYINGGSNTYVPTGVKLANNVIKMSTGQAVYNAPSNSSLVYTSEGNVYNAPSGLGLSNSTGFSNKTLTFGSRSNGILSVPVVLQDSAVNSSNYTNLLSGVDLLGVNRTNRYDVGCEEKNGSGTVYNKLLENTTVGYGKTIYTNQNSTTSMLPRWITLNSIGCDSIVMLNLTVHNTKLNVKAILEGYYDPSSITPGVIMKSTLNIDDLSVTGHAISTDPTATDSVTVQLWSPDSLNYNTPNYSVSTVLHNNGMINVVLPRGTYERSYYIALRHRNSVETWSANPIQIGESASLDFTSSLNQAYSDGNNPPMKNLGNGLYALYGGDVNQDGTVDGFDLQATENDASEFAYGYNNTDCTGDGASDGFDMQLIENNSALFLFMARP